jgi:hypothetical protein
MGKFKKLTDEDIEYIKAIYFTDISHEEKLDILTSRFGVKGRTIRGWWIKLELTESGRIRRLPKILIEARERELDADTDIIMVTAAQNKTITNIPMYNNMMAYAEYIQKKFNKKVQIVVIPSRYRNPTSPVEADKKKVDMWWDEVVSDHLYYNKIKFGDVLISATSRIRPTANMPLSGYESLASNNHLVIGHPRLHLKVMPRFKNDPLRLMCTSGYITRKNYSDSKAGDKGYVHHSYGFVMVEKNADGTCHPPRLVKVKDDGSFIDYKYSVSGGDVRVVKNSSAYIWGDIHHRELDMGKFKASMKLIKELKPDSSIFHDLFDGSTVNPHEKKDLFIKKLKITKGLHLIDVEVEESMEFLEKFVKKFKGQVYVVQSNHDDFLDRHINNENWKNDLHNSEAYLKYATIQQTVDLREYGNIYGAVISKRFGDKVKYVKNNESLKIESYQCGYHGDHGVNGARGSITSFKRLNTKMIHGHGHSPTMIDGVTMVGVSCKLWQYYNSKGLSSWAFADSIIHKNGKNQLIIFDDRTLEFTNLK